MQKTKKSWIVSNGRFIIYRLLERLRPTVYIYISLWCSNTSDGVGEHSSILIVVTRFVEITTICNFATKRGARSHPKCSKLFLKYFVELVPNHKILFLYTYNITIGRISENFVFLGHTWELLWHFTTLWRSNF